MKEALHEIGVRHHRYRPTGRQKAIPNSIAAEYVVDFLPKVKLEVVVPEGIADRTVEAIAAAAEPSTSVTARLLSSIEGALRIRTGEKDDDAI